MNEKYLRYPGNKWLKQQILQKNERIEPHLPRTAVFSKKNCFEFVDLFPHVYVKPRLGGGGSGIYKISAADGHYLLQGSKGKTLCFHRHHLWRVLKPKIGGRPYLIQQGIDLMTIGGRLVDFRALLLKPSDKWQFIGIMGKCGAKNKHVTNHCQGGKPISFKEALRAGLKWSDEQCGRLEQEIRELSLRTADTLNEYFPLITELGLDIAVDRKGKLWLLEANSKPRFDLFKSHENPDLYAEIAQTVHHLRLRAAQIETSSLENGQ
jgi:hypothetical protein